MVVIEFILELITWFFVEIIFNGLILGIWKLLKKAIDLLRCLVIGLKKRERSNNPIRELEKKLLYKKIELIEDVNSTLRKGQIGAVLEVIDTKTVFAEFYDQSNKQIEINNELVFKIGTNQFRRKN